MLISKHNVTLFNDTVTQHEWAKYQPVKTTNLSRTWKSNDGSQWHQEALHSMLFLKFKNTNMWLNSSCFNISLILFSMARWLLAMMEDHWKVVFFHFPLLIARQFINPFVEELTAFTVNPHLIQISLFPPRFSVFDHIRSSQTVLSFAVL